MRKFIFPLVIVATMVIASRCHAWYAGYVYNSGTLASVWAQESNASPRQVEYVLDLALSATY